MRTSEQTIIPAAEWQARAAGHRARAEQWSLPARQRRGSNRSHPVEDFLFTYYHSPISKLEEWHPGYGSAFESVEPLPAWLAKNPYRQTDGMIFADPARLDGKEITRLRWIHDLLAATADRAPNHACHGLHEWAMVYRGTEVRHSTTTALRLPQAEIDALVSSQPVRCSHFDAFRFFHAEARPLNRLQPTLNDRHDLEQPACVHANMDLYKWAAKSVPWVGSELLLDCFEQALELRHFDMRASPYDLTEYGLDPVRIETPDGRRDYEQEQKRLAVKAAPLRARLIMALARVLRDLPA
ncbi:MAG: hypothetical protein JWO82_1083 [Akkermansiaceae bacterium]|nr:hypothetical protein [Akkermansiaceae bacterium]